MNRKNMLKTVLIAGLFFLALGGWLLHLRVHPVEVNKSNLVPFISGIISVFCLPLMFCFKPTITLAYILNGFFAIIGTITMAHFSIVHFTAPATFEVIFLNTTLADISLLWGKFAIGKVIFDLEFLKTDTDIKPAGRFFRYPNMGWWWVHLFALAIVYALGNILWK